MIPTQQSIKEYIDQSMTLAQQRMTAYERIRVAFVAFMAALSVLALFAYRDSTNKEQSTSQQNKCSPVEIGEPLVIERDYDASNPDNATVYEP